MLKQGVDSIHDLGGTTIYNSYLFSVQHECIPQGILSMDVLCQAKSGMGKTAVFVLATLQQLEPVDGQVQYTNVPGSQKTFLFICSPRL